MLKQLIEMNQQYPLISYIIIAISSFIWDVFQLSQYGALNKELILKAIIKQIVIFLTKASL